jgi:hypothetical protein
LWHASRHRCVVGVAGKNAEPALRTDRVHARTIKKFPASKTQNVAFRHTSRRQRLDVGFGHRQRRGAGGAEQAFGESASTCCAASASGRDNEDEATADPLGGLLRSAMRLVLFAVVVSWIGLRAAAWRIPVDKDAVIDRVFASAFGICARPSVMHFRNPSRNMGMLFRRLATDVVVL